MRQGTSSNGSLSQWLLGDRDAEHLGLVHEVGLPGAWTSRLSWLLRLSRSVTVWSLSDRHVWACVHAASMRQEWQQRHGSDWPARRNLCRSEA